MAASDFAEFVATEDELLDRTVLPPNWPHERPEVPFTPDEAHHVMQRHASCTLEVCARKRAAYRALAEAGELVPDARAERHLR